MNPLVSIITPCYNGEKYLIRFLDSVLQQTYAPIELIIVDDGSTDNSDEIIQLFSPQLIERGIALKYIRQQNGGAAAAMNAGLKVFQGKYLSWIDCDDWMTPDCIEQKVSYLETHGEKALVVCNIGIVEENNINKQTGVLKPSNSKEGNFFLRLLNEEIYIAPPIGWMIRTDMFLKVNPLREIFAQNRMGQNWQMLLPISYYYDGGYIDKILGYYLIRSSSVSHGGKEEDFIKKSYGYEENTIAALKSLCLEDEEPFLQIIQERYSRSRLNIASKYRLKEWIDIEFKKLAELGKVTSKDKYLYLSGKYLIWKFFFFPYDLLRRFVNKFIRIVKNYKEIKS